MSGYGTKKRGGDVALQMTFPDVASAFVASAEPQPYGYIGRAMIGKAPLPVADDLQQRYHKEKSHYANKSALDGVYNEQRSDWLLRHNTYGYTQPRPVLAQRIFANPSLGNQADIYAARNDIHGLSGGWHYGPMGEAYPDPGDKYWGEDWFNAFGEWLDGVAPWVAQYGWDMLSMGAPKGFGPRPITPNTSIIKDMGKRKAKELERIRKEKEKWDKEQELNRRGRDEYQRQMRDLMESDDEGFGPRRGRGDLHGGVLRTAEGQRYGRNILRDRIRQLDAIEAARSGEGTTEFGPTSFPLKPELPEEPEGAREAQKIELRTKLYEIRAVYEENRNFGNLIQPVLVSLNKTLSEASRLLFRLAIDFNMSDFNGVLNFIEGTERLARAFQANAVQIRLYNQVQNMAEYTKEMAGFVNRSRKDKIAKSRNILQTLGISDISEFEAAGRMRGGADTCGYPAWVDKYPNNYESGDKVEINGKAYEATTKTTTKPPDKYWKEIACGNNPKIIDFDPAKVRPPPPKSGTDFSKGETQDWRLVTPPSQPRDAPALAPEEPESEHVTSRPLTKFARRERGAKFTEDQRVRFGDRQGAYYGEEIGDRVPVAPVPVPILPDGEYVHPGSGYVRKAFPKFTVQNKPSNSLKPRRMAPIPKLPMFQETASGIFSSPRLGLPKVTSVPEQVPFTYTGGRAGLPKTVEGFVELAKKLNSAGHKIRVNPTSKLSSIRQNFIRNLLI